MTRFGSRRLQPQRSYLEARASISTRKGTESLTQSLVSSPEWNHTALMFGNLSLLQCLPHHLLTFVLLLRGCRRAVLAVWIRGIKKPTMFGLVMMGRLESTRPSFCGGSARAKCLGPHANFHNAGQPPLAPLADSVEG
jgi:hypothetical protein